MSYKPRTLFRIIEDINKSLFLPHIQRPFVWQEEQMRRLFDSLMRDYPIQTILFWRTKDQIKARKFMYSVDHDVDLHTLYDEATSAADVEKVFVLDGQQRLQTLYSLFAGAVKSPTGKDNLFAYMNITSGDEEDDEGILYPIVFSSGLMELPYYRLSDLLGKHAQMNAYEIAEMINDQLDSILMDEPEERKTRSRQVCRNCSQLVSLLLEEKHFWVEELDGVAKDFPYKRILDIFVRVNSGGTKLESADLMFAAMKEGWDDVEEKIEDVVDMLNSTNSLHFDKTLVLKCIVVASGKGANLRPELFTSSEGGQLLDTIEQNWDKLEETFHQLRDFIVNELKLYGDKVIRSYSSFVPLFDFLFSNPQPNEANRILMRGYYYKSQLFNWYSRQTDNVINGIHNIVGRSLGGVFPLYDLISYFEERDYTISLSKYELDEPRIRFIILNLLYSVRFGTSPFNVKFKGNEPHIDHIYPKSMLRSRLGLDACEINSIGNFRFVGATDNIRKRAELPDSYFLRLKNAGIDIAGHLLLPDVSNNPALLAFTPQAYQKFRDRRLSAIFDIAKKVVNPEYP